MIAMFREKHIMTEIKVSKFIPKLGETLHQNEIFTFKCGTCHLAVSNSLNLKSSTDFSDRAYRVHYDAMLMKES